MEDVVDDLVYWGEPDAELDAPARAVIGAAIEVHRQFGPGLTEDLYENALCIELALRNVPYARQVTIDVRYKDQPAGKFRLDLLVGGKLIVELKAVEQLAPIHKAQAITYLKVTGHRLALLINFNVPLLKEGVKRIIVSS